VIIALVCSPKPLENELKAVSFFRGDVECFAAHRVQEARVMAIAARPSLVVVDRELPGGEELIASLREEPATRRVPIVVVARGEFAVEDVSLLSAGANAVLRFPPGPEWDERLARLVHVAARTEARLPVELVLRGPGPGAPRVLEEARTVNLSASGMLVETVGEVAARVGESVAFTLRPPGSRPIVGRARVQRKAGESQVGLEFLALEEDGSQRIRRIVTRAAA
jgi:DNA-binding response OmpR family regulator